MRCFKHIGWKIAHCHFVHHFSIRSIYSRQACTAEPARILCNDIQDGLNVSRGTGSHAQDFARGGLLLEIFGDLPVILLDLGEQTRMLNGDANICRDGCEQALGVFVEQTLRRGALYTHDSDGFPAWFDRHTEIRERLLTDQGRAQFFTAFHEIPVDQ